MNRAPMITLAAVRLAAVRLAAVRLAAVRLAAVAALVVGLTLTQVGPAAAHVRVKADGTTSGSYSALTFRVPNESDTASTTKISVVLPQDTPFLSVRTKAVPGWTAAMSEEKLPQPVDIDGTSITQAIQTVTWTATDGAEIGPGEYQEFSISVGPLPAAGTILLPTAQTYSDAKVVRWDQPIPANGAEPDHPAPALVVTAAEPAAGESTGQPSAPAAASAPDNGARGLAAIGLLVGIAGLVVGATALRRRASS